MSEDVRRFQVPTINFSAGNYTELISWESSQLTEPPILKDVSQETLSESVATHDATLLELNYLSILKQWRELSSWLQKPLHQYVAARNVKDT